MKILIFENVSQPILEDLRRDIFTNFVPLLEI